LHAYLGSYTQYEASSPPQKFNILFEIIVQNLKKIASSAAFSMVADLRPWERLLMKLEQVEFYEHHLT
jgi:hypothetical protein